MSDIAMQSRRFTKQVYATGRCSPNALVYETTANIPLSRERNYSENIPNWRERIARGEDATTSMDNFIEQVLVAVPGSVEVEYDRCTYRGWKPNMAIGFWDTHAPLKRLTGQNDLEQPAINGAKARFAEELRDRLVSWQSGEFFGELRETLKMITDRRRKLLTGFSDYLDTLKKGRRRYKRRRDLKQYLADSYLEYSFGWTPLASDIADAVSALKDYRDGVVKHDQIWATATETDVDATETDLFAYGLVRVDWTWRRTYRVQVTYRGKIRAEVMDPQSVHGLAQFGFRFEEFLPTAWELLPWSFVVDYFSNIQEIVVGWSYGQSHLKWANQTIRRTADVDAIGQHVPVEQMKAAYGISGWNLVSFTPMVYILRTKEVKRDPYNGSFSPGLHFEIPGVDSRKWVNLLALVTSKKRALTPYYASGS